MARILVFEEDEARRATLLQGLQEAGHEVIAPAASVLALRRLVREFEPEVIIIDTESPDRDTLEHICVVSRDSPRPIVMFSADADGGKIREAVAAGVSAYVVDGLTAQRLQPILEVAVARFAQTQALRDELAQAHARLDERKQVERAKGILMQARGMSEDEAYRALRTMAMENSRRIAEVAEQVIAMRHLLGDRS